MSYSMSSGEIIERALRKIRAFSINDQTPDPVHVEEARFYLDMILAETSGSGPLMQKRQQAVTLSLTTATATLDLQPGSPDVDEDDPTLTQIPPTGIVDVKSARLLVNDSDCGEIKLIRLLEFEKISVKSTGGQPTHATVRMNGIEKPIMTFWPVPTFTSGTMKVRLLVEKGFPTIVGELDDRPDIRAAWQLWLVTRLAYELGSGPIVMRSRDELTAMQRDALRAKQRLEAHSNREPLTQPRVVKSAW